MTCWLSRKTPTQNQSSKTDLRRSRESVLGPIYRRASKVGMGRQLSIMIWLDPYIAFKL